MNVKELKGLLSYYSDDCEVIFEDVCGNWQFEIYYGENLIDNDGNEFLNLVGDEI